MTASVLQFVATDPATSAISTSLAFSSNTTAGSTLLSYPFGNFVAMDATTPMADSQTNGYSLLDTVSTGQFLNAYYAANTVGGANTVTGKWASSTGIRPLLLVEVGGVTTAPLDGHAGNFQASPAPTTPDGITATTTSANQPALLVAVSNALFDTAPDPGTGWTDHGSFWNTSAGGIRLQSKRVVLTGSQTALFTGLTTASKFTHITVLTESAGGFGPLLSVQRNRLVL